MASPTLVVDRKQLAPALEMLELAQFREGIFTAGFIRCRPVAHGVQLSLAWNVYAEVTLKGEGQWPFDKDTFYSRRTIMAFFATGRREGLIKMSARDGQLVLTEGRRQLAIAQTEPVTGYGLWENVSTHSLRVRDDLLSALDVARLCVSEGVGQARLNCVFVDASTKQVQVAASDERVILYGCLAGSNRNVQLAVPLGAVEMAVAFKAQSLLYSDKYLAVESDCGRAWHAMIPNAQKEFPLASVVKYAEKSAKQPVCAVVDGDRLVRMMHRAVKCLIVEVKERVLVVSGVKGERAIRVQVTTDVAKLDETIPAKIASTFSVEWPL
ncbi:MAG: hypothetical protein KGL39_49415, partial [Patescibacteria group bacterium]|nr:hypothetical protein [Patescibacteria group bacterium]